VTDLVAGWVFELAVWTASNPRVAVPIDLAVVVVLLVADHCLQIVYRISCRDGEAVRAGITHWRRFPKRMWEYASGRDRSTKREAWQQRVRWWTLPIPFRVAKLLGCRAWTGKGEQPGWSRWFITVELKWGRKRAERYESSVIRAAEPWFNTRDNPRTVPRWRPEPRVLTLPWRRGREKVAA
jgi:hypothetical protein